MTSHLPQMTRTLFVFRTRIEQEKRETTRQGSILLQFQFIVATKTALKTALLIIASKFVSQLVTILPRGIQPPFNVIYSCLFIGRRYACSCKRGERWRPAERESPDRGTSDEMAKKLEDFNDRTCSVQYDATRFNDVPVNPLLSTMGSRTVQIPFFSRGKRLLP